MPITYATPQSSAWVVVRGILLCLALNGHTADPDPRDLLEGVIAQREQIPASVFHLRWTYEEPRVTNKEEFILVSDGARHLVLGTNRNDIYRALCNGEEAFILQDDSVTVRDRGTDTLYRLFDPRILGLCQNYTGSLRPRSILDSSRGDIRLVARDEIDGRSCWVVRRQMEEWAAEYWIDPANNFATYQHLEYDSGGELRGRVRSFYHNPAYPWLPSKVVHEFFTPPGRRTVEVLEARIVEPIPPETWTLAGLFQGLTFTNPVMVTDVRKGLFIGSWDGQRLIPFNEEATKPATTPVNLRRLLVWVLLAGLVIFPLSLLWLRKQKALGGPKNFSAH